MRFDSLYLKAFGHFTDYPLEFDPTKNFHMIYGPNEAGKSTTLRSITNFLYGFPQRTNDAFLHDNRKLRIEGQLRNSKGEVLAFARRKGNKNTVLDADDQPIDEKKVEQFLQGIPQSQFQSMYALNHDTLRQGGEQLLQSGGSAGEGLFSAASGINILREIIDEFSKKSGAIYKRTALKPELNKLLKEEKELNKKLAENQLKVQTWKTLEREYQEGKKTIDHFNQQIKELREKQKKLERIQLMLPKISKREDLLAKIGELGEVPNLPEDFSEKRQQAQNLRNAATNDKQKLESDIEKLKQELENISIPEKVLEQASIIDALYREVQTYENNVRKIPELEGQKSRITEEIVSIMKEIDASNADLNKVEKYRLSTEKKETIRQLIRQKPSLDQALENAQNEHHRLQQELATKQNELANIPELPSIEELERIMDKIKREGQIEETIHKLSISINELERKIIEEIESLPLWSGTAEEFQDFTVSILMETIHKYEKEQNELENDLQKVMELIQAQKEQIAQYEESIRHLESLAEIPSIDNLKDARKARDTGWEYIRKKLQSDEWDENIGTYTKGQPIEIVYEKQVIEADQIADTMRVEAEKVGQKNKLLHDIEIAKSKLTDLEQKESELQGKLEDWKKDWQQLWEAYGFLPLSPTEMKEWLTKYEKIKSLIQEYKTTKSEYHDLTEKKEQLQFELTETLSTFITVPKNINLNDLLDMGEKQLKEIRDIVNKQKNLEVTLRDIQQKVLDAKSTIQEKQDALHEWKVRWVGAIEQTTITEDTLPNVAEKLLSQYEACIEKVDVLATIVKDQKTYNDQITLFEEKVEQLLQSIDLSLEDSHSMAVNQIYSTLQTAQKDQITRNNLSAQLKKLEAELKTSNEQLQEAKTTLNQLFAIANSESIEELIEIENKYLMKQKYEESLANVEDEMMAQGNGRSIQQLIEEANELDADKIDAELDDLERDIEQIESERSEHEQAYGVIKKDYEEKIQGQSSHSIQVEQEKNSIHAQIVSLTEEYVQLKLASILLQKGIEEYRERNQSPILTRAGEIFKKLTLQSFVDLTIDYNEKDEPIIMGVRQDGEKVSVEGMSDGTTDQLYLSLRIAYLEKNASENEPIPFIVDDILVHFDDERSKETLKVLLELSQHTQIIFFTHHARLVEIMKEFDEKLYEVIEINQKHSVVS